MSAPPRVSVVMCAYNGIGLIERAIGDIVAQSFGDWELVISDDGSSDGTRDYLGGLDNSRIRVILQDRNLGYVANKNVAIASARGDLITQQDQDDRSHADRLARQVEAVERSGMAIVGCGYRMFDVAGRVRSASTLDRETIITAHDPAAPYPFWFPSLMVRREVFAEVGPFDDYFAGTFGDDLYWTAKANEQFPILCLPDRLYDYVESVGSITSVAGSERKLVMGEVLDTLLRQRRSTGTDDLGTGRINALEKRLLADRRLLAQNLQVYAARAIDQRRWAEARALIRRAFGLSPLRLSLARTILYYCRAAARGSKAPPQPK